MALITRLRAGEEIALGNDIIIQLVRTSGQSAELRISKPRDVSFSRVAELTPEQAESLRAMAGERGTLH